MSSTGGYIGDNIGEYYVEGLFRAILGLETMAHIGVYID